MPVTKWKQIVIITTDGHYKHMHNIPTCKDKKYKKIHDYMSGKGIMNNP